MSHLDFTPKRTRAVPLVPLTHSGRTREHPKPNAITLLFDGETRAHEHIAAMEKLAMLPEGWRVYVFNKAKTFEDFCKDPKNAVTVTGRDASDLWKSWWGVVEYWRAK